VPCFKKDIKQLSNVQRGMNGTGSKLEIKSNKEQKEMKEDVIEE